MPAFDCVISCHPVAKAMAMRQLTTKAVGRPHMCLLEARAAIHYQAESLHHCELLAGVLSIFPEAVRGMKVEAKGFSILPLSVRCGPDPLLSELSTLSLMSAWVSAPLAAACPLAAASTSP